MQVISLKKFRHGQPKTFFFCVALRRASPRAGDECQPCGSALANAQPIAPPPNADDIARGPVRNRATPPCLQIANAQAVREYHDPASIGEKTIGKPTSSWPYDRLSVSPELAQAPARTRKQCRPRAPRRKQCPDIWQTRRVGQCGSRECR